MAEEAPGDREIPKAELIAQLRDLGVEPGGVLLVHASFRAVRPIEGGLWCDRSLARSLGTTRHAGHAIDDR
jgi:aminoglycoside N3'-acetyltransferase